MIRGLLFLQFFIATRNPLGFGLCRLAQHAMADASNLPGAPGHGDAIADEVNKVRWCLLVLIGAYWCLRCLLVGFGVKVRLCCVVLCCVVLCWLGVDLVGIGVALVGKYFVGFSL